VEIAPGVLVSILLVADDVALVAASATAHRHQVAFLRMYCDASASALNKDKCSCIVVGRIELAQLHFGLSRPEGERYLGYFFTPLGIKSRLSELLQSLHTDIIAWKSCASTLFGAATIFNSYAASKLWYHLLLDTSSAVLDPGPHAKVHRNVLNYFLFYDSKTVFDATTVYRPTIGLDRCFQSKSSGGLGLVDIWSRLKALRASVMVRVASVVHPPFWVDAWRHRLATLDRHGDWRHGLATVKKAPGASSLFGSALKAWRCCRPSASPEDPLVWNSGLNLSGPWPWRISDMYSSFLRASAPVRLTTGQSLWKHHLDINFDTIWGAIQAIPGRPVVRELVFRFFAHALKSARDINCPFCQNQVSADIAPPTSFNRDSFVRAISDSLYLHLFFTCPHAKEIGDLAAVVWRDWFGDNAWTWSVNDFVHLTTPRGRRSVGLAFFACTLWVIWRDYCDASHDRLDLVPEVGATSSRGGLARSRDLVGGAADTDLRQRKLRASLVCELARSANNFYSSIRVRLSRWSPNHSAQQSKLDFERQWLSPAGLCLAHNGLVVLT
jgi:hypothetical protein